MENRAYKDLTSLIVYTAVHVVLCRERRVLRCGGYSVNNNGVFFLLLRGSPLQLWWLLWTP